MSAPSVASRTTAFTPLPPSCVLFVPQDPSLIVVGTYHLDEDTSAKSGSLLLYRKHDLSLVASHETHAILDIKFSPHSPSQLAVAQSHGTLSLFSVTLPANVSCDSMHVLFDSSLLILSIAFSPRDPQHLAFTLSNGEAGIFSLESSTVVYRYKPHSLETWTCEFSSGDGPANLYTGGDDSAICAWDVEAGVQLWKDSKTHQAGVTAILSREGESGAILTGSYDEWLRAFDCRTRRVESEIRLGGGVWRLQMREGNSVLASCMHAGARIVSAKGGGSPLSVVAKFEEHESMNYGSHIHNLDPDTVVSCSFYDKRLCTWSVYGAPTA